MKPSTFIAVAIPVLIAITTVLMLIMSARNQVAQPNPTVVKIGATLAVLGVIALAIVVVLRLI